MPTRLFCSYRNLAPALHTVGVVVVIAFLSVLSSAALGANPAEEMAKVGTADPKGNSWLSIQNSIEQFGHPEFTTQGSWKQRRERSCGSPTSPKSMLMWYKPLIHSLL